MSWTWGVTILSLIGVVANIYKKRWCFGVWLIANIFWAIYDWNIGAYAQSVLQGIYAGLSIWGLIRWKD